MKRSFRAMTLPALALGILLSSGCGPSSTNDESVIQTKATSNGPEIPVFKTYGERQQYEAEQAAKNRAAAKGAPKAQPATPKEPPVTPK
jgi:hypothetical protein